MIGIAVACSICGGGAFWLAAGVEYWLRLDSLQIIIY